MERQVRRARKTLERIRDNWQDSRVKTLAELTLPISTISYLKDPKRFVNRGFQYNS